PCGIPSDANNSRYMDNDIKYGNKCHKCASSTSATTSMESTLRADNREKRKQDGDNARSGRGRGGARAGRGGRSATMVITNGLPSTVGKENIPVNGGRSGGRGRGGSDGRGRGAKTSRNTISRTATSFGELIPETLNTNADIFVGKKIALECKGDLEERLRSFFRGDIPNNVLKSGHVVGTVLAVTPGKKKFYNVAWEFTGLGVSPVSLSFMLDGVHCAARLEEKQRRSACREATPSSSLVHPLNRNGLRTIMQRVSPGEEGEVYESDSSDDSVSAEDNNLELTWIHPADCNVIDNEQNEQLGTNDIENLNGISWNHNGRLPHPSGISDKEVSTIKPEFLSHFRTPISSFLAFLPIVLWETMVFESNHYAEYVMAKKGERKISGATWAGEITLSEMMAFFGILTHLTMISMPGRTYTHLWKISDIHPYTKVMLLRRFQQIRAVLHLSDNDNQSPGNDSLRKIRFMLNALKITLGKYLDVGRDLALDEASVASRSMYGRDLIFYNPSKNCGKYHFRFYMVCCATTYACLRLRMHTKDVADLADCANLVDIVNKENLSFLSKLVLDMVRPFEHKGHIINMDNYYTSPTAFIHLRSKGILARGTVRINRRHFPKSVIFSQQEARIMPRVSSKIAVNEQFRMTAAGWLDGNPVHLLSTADGSEIGTVTRRTGGRQQDVSAPVLVKRYNKAMQAVACR
ncbi:MAG: hypothetical protein ACREOZ_04230, partial [Gloeomargaritales cyanobacterium]